MHKILRKETLSDVVKLYEIKAPRVAKKAQPGQFVIIRLNETGERIPLTIADFSRENGAITLIVQEVGKSTMEMGQLEVGDSIENVVGPMGHPTEIKNYGKVVVVGGGVGIAPIFPIARALKQAGNQVISIIGARNKSLLFWEERIREFADELIVCTDDGSAGRKALVTVPLKEVLDAQKDVARIWAIGPTIMMKFAAETTRPYGVPTIVSLNTIMIDGTGMCGGCRVGYDGGVKFVCVDGPEFNGHLVDWELMLARLSFYHNDEREAAQRMKDHICDLNTAADTLETNLNF
jgi:ferredoxin--NADP+ reductase